MSLDFELNETVGRAHPPPTIRPTAPQPRARHRRLPSSARSARTSGLALSLLSLLAAARPARTSGLALSLSLSLTLFALLSLFPATALADATSIRVLVEGCSLHSEEVTRLVQLELSSVIAAGSDASAYSVEISCDGAEIHIALFDPLTQKSLSRTVVAPPPSQPEPERVVALTVAQLYRAAWLELASDSPSALQPSSADKRPPEELASARRAAEQALSAARPAAPAGAAQPDTANTPPPGTAPLTSTFRAVATATSATLPLAGPPLPTPALPGSWSLIAAVGARIRHTEAPLVLPSIEIAATWGPGKRPFWVLASAGIEWTDVARQTGTLETRLVRAAAGFGVEPLTSGRWSGFLEAQGGVTHLTISGHAARAPYVGQDLTGSGFDASLALGLSARWSPVRLELLGRIGLLAGTPTGIVASDEDLSLDGAWTGAELRFNWLL